MKRRELPAAVMPLALLALLILWSAAHAQTTAGWVPFDATFVRTELGMPQVIGSFNRSADGSTREESDVDGPGKPHVVLIMNVAKRLQYRFERGAWASYPVNFPPEGWHPVTVERDPRRYAPGPSIQGLPSFRFVNPQGVVQFVVPALNDFALSTERPDGGREVFSNVVVREQRPELFEPPPGAEVEVHTSGGSGAIYYPANSDQP